MQSSLRRKIENRSMPLTSRSWVQLTATCSSAKFAWLAWHRKSEILGNDGGICLFWKGIFILGTEKLHFKLPLRGSCLHDQSYYLSGHSHELHGGVDVSIA